MNTRFLAVAKDPRIIPGVHHHCDEWCDTCALTERCLSYRCTIEFRKEKQRRSADPTFASLDEAVAFTKELSAVEGVPTEELDLLLAGPPGQSGLQTSSPLANMALEYAVRVALALRRVDAVLLCTTPPTEPTPIAVVAWYHVRIYLRIVRALVGAERSSPRMDDVLGSAKLTLVSVRRSRRALESLEGEFKQSEIAALLNMLEGIERGIDERFPGARQFVRIGLDVPVA